MVQLFVCCLGPLAICDIPSNALNLSHASVGSRDRMVYPMLPRQRSIRPQQLAFDDFHARVSRELSEPFECFEASGLRKQFYKSRSNQRVRPPTEKSAVGSVYKGQPGVRQKTADKVGLRFNHLTILR